MIESEIMEIFHLNDTNAEELAEKAAAALHNSGVVLYPSDTLYGLGADALSDEMVARIYAIKGRDTSKPMHALVADIEMAGRYAYVTPAAERLFKDHGGKVSLVLGKREEAQTGIARGTATFGIRIPDHWFCSAMCRAYGGPITATSANAAGEETEDAIEAVLKQLGDEAAGIDLAIGEGRLPRRLPSTVVDLSGPDPRVLREGAVAAEEIFLSLRQA